MGIKEIRQSTYKNGIKSKVHFLSFEQTTYTLEIYLRLGETNPHKHARIVAKNMSADERTARDNRLPRFVYTRRSASSQKRFPFEDKQKESLNYSCKRMQSAKACCVCKIILLLFRTTTTELIQVRMGRVYGFLSICQLGNGAHFLL